MDIGAAHHGMQHITQCALGRIAVQLSVHLYVPDRRLDRTAPLDTRLVDEIAAPCALDGGHQQRLHAFFPNALSPARQAARVDRRFGLQVRLAEKSTANTRDGSVGCVEGVLRVQQAGRQACWQCEGGPAAK